MAVTAVRAGIAIHEVEDPPGGELLVHALPELPDGAHAPICLDELFTREPHIGHLQATSKIFSAFEEGRVLIFVNAE